jgi:hypothetical protein
MPYRLRDELSFCACAGKAVFLDLRDDRYFCLGPALEQSFARWAESPYDDRHGPGLGPLVERGLLVRADAAPAPRRSAAAVERDIIGPDEVRLSLADVARAAFAELVIAARLRRWPIAALVRSCEASGACDVLPNADEMRRAKRVAAAFALTGLFLGSHNRCLSRALAAMLMCHRFKVYPDLVLGVRTNPFGAHAWVQLGNAVIVGDHEQARLFTPILSVR